MTLAQDILTLARQTYAAAPDHTPPPGWPRGERHCAVTAMSHAMFDPASGRALPYKDVEPAWHALRAAMGDPEDIARWNADHSTAEVLAAFDRAIEAVA